VRAGGSAAAPVACGGAIVAGVAGLTGAWWALIVGGLLGLVLVADFRRRP
jgi:hypothetical protein